MEPSQSPTTTSAPDLNSQQALALSIAKAVLADLPGREGEDVAGPVESALLTEAGHNETTIAGFRTLFLAVMAAVNAIALLPVRFVGETDADWANVAFLGAAAAAALLFYRALWRGWYAAWLRKAVPFADALLIVLSFWIYEATREGSGTVPPGIAGLSVTACVFLTFTGALRLTRSAAVLSTVVALLAWIAVAVAGAIEWQAIVLIAAALVATGILGSYVTRTIRRVITNEVGRTRVRRMYDEATEAIRAREEVLRIVSHDLRNPLNAVGMTAEMLMEETELPVERRMDYLQRIRRSSERMNRLIQDLLDVARMEAGTLSVRPEPVRCGELLGDVTEMMAPLAADRQLDFRVLPGDTLPDVSVDRERMVQVFSNLLGNAFKFTAPGGRVYIRGERMGDKVRFSVTDTGSGIAPEHLQDVFGRLWQANRGDGRGLGLGLAIAKSIVEAHGERIGVDSRIGEGTTFWFTAPVVRE